MRLPGVKIISKYGVGKAIKIKCIYLRNRFLMQLFKFDVWHLTPVTQKDYAINIIKELNFCFSNNKDSVVVECGCGLGDIIGGVRCRKKYGYDISEEVIQAARYLHRDVIFRQGSFKDIKEEYIDCLIMVNFIHEIQSSELEKELNLLMNRTNIRLIVMDRITNIKGTHYKYEQHGEEFFPLYGYRLKFRSEKYNAAEGACRFIEYWEKIK